MPRVRSYSIAGFMVLQAILSLLPVFILGASIQWPASLDWPASQILPLVATQAQAVTQGYSLYLVYSLLFLPLVLVLSQVVRTPVLGPALRLAVGLAALSTLARTLGIVRWLGPVPFLAASYADPSTDAALRTTLETVFTAFDAYGGTLGEVFGIGLWGGSALATLGIGMLRNPRVSRGFGWVTVGAGFAQLTVVPVFGPWTLAPSLAATAMLFWLLSGAFFLVRGASVRASGK